MRKTKPNMMLSTKISSKDLVQVKKYPISRDYTLVNPAIGKGSFGSVYKIINKQSGLVWAAKRIPIARNMEKQVQEILILKQLVSAFLFRITQISSESSMSTKRKLTSMWSWKYATEENFLTALSKEITSIKVSSGTT